MLIRENEKKYVSKLKQSSMNRENKSTGDFKKCHALILLRPFLCNLSYLLLCSFLIIIIFSVSEAELADALTSWAFLTPSSAASLVTGIEIIINNGVHFCCAFYRSLKAPHNITPGRPFLYHELP